MRNILIFCISVMLFALPLLSHADSFEKQASYTVCFTPGQDCTSEIVGVINNAINNVWVQAYSFTSRPIAQALVLAKERGVHVQIIFDKDALIGKRGTLRYFTRHQIPVWIDNAPAIAHNKVMIVDETQVITGSFNFTRAAQQQNAENVLIIYDAGLAKKYLANWQSRQHVAEFYKSRVYSTSAETADQTNWLNKFWQWLVKWFKQLNL